MNLPELLTQDRDGFIHLTGHRIGLNHVVTLYRDERYTPEMLADHFPTLTLAQIHKVIAFYLENQDEADGYVSQCLAEVERQAADAQPGPTGEELRRRMEAIHGVPEPRT